MNTTHETAEFVLPGHPDKLCDAVVDAIVDTVRRADPKGQCGLEAACVFDRIWLTGRIAATRTEVLASLQDGGLEQRVRDTYASAGYGEDSSLYRRSLVTAVTDGGSVLAWAYIYLGDADAFPLIPSGRWTGA